MYPTIDEALRELELGNSINPGRWVEHCKYTGEAARNIAEAAGLDKEKAYVLLFTSDSDYTRKRFAVKRPVILYPREIFFVLQGFFKFLCPIIRIQGRVIFGEYLPYKGMGLGDLLLGQ